MKDPSTKEEVLKWIARYLVEHIFDDEWVSDPSPIKKSLLNFAVNFWWAVVRSRICPTMVDNHLTLDQMVIVASIMAGYEIDFTRCILAEIYEREL